MKQDLPERGLSTAIATAHTELGEVRVFEGRGPPEAEYFFVNLGASPANCIARYT